MKKASDRTSATQFTELGSGLDDGGSRSEGHFERKSRASGAGDDQFDESVQRPHAPLLVDVDVGAYNERRPLNRTISWQPLSVHLVRRSLFPFRVFKLQRVQLVRLFVD